MYFSFCRTIVSIFRNSMITLHWIVFNFYTIYIFQLNLLIYIKIAPCLFSLVDCLHVILFLIRSHALLTNLSTLFGSIVSSPLFTRLELITMKFSCFWAKKLLKFQFNKSIRHHKFLVAVVKYALSLLREECLCCISFLFILYCHLSIARLSFLLCKPTSALFVCIRTAESLRWCFDFSILDLT